MSGTNWVPKKSWQSRNLIERELWSPSYRTMMRGAQIELNRYAEASFSLIKQLCIVDGLRLNSETCDKKRCLAIRQSTSNG